MGIKKDIFYDDPSSIIIRKVLQKLPMMIKPFDPDNSNPNTGLN